MKRFLTLILACTLATNLLAQTDTTKVDIVNKNVVTVIENDDKVQVTLGKNEGIEVVTDDWGDTTHVRVGRRTFKVIEGDNGTYVKVSKDKKRQKWGGRFNPHWAGLEFGPNIMTNIDYSIYGGDYQEAVDADFLELNPGKSLTWNLNIAEYAFTNKRKNFGVVTGLGFSFQDYAFDDRNYTIIKEDDTGIIVPKPINPNEHGENVKKTKLHINYMTVPLMLEVKTPLRMGSSRLYLAGGVIGSLYLGSHTKYKYEGGDKHKKHSSFHINKWKYELTGRIGFGDFCVFANYSMTTLFKDGKGPGVQPMMIGISFPNI
jgi:hypothetical protein